MSGLPIIFRAIDVGFSQPTKIYRVVDNDGKWEMVLEYTLKEATIEDIAHVIQTNAVASHKKVFVPDSHPNVIEQLKARGIRAK